MAVPTSSSIRKSLSVATATLLSGVGAQAAVTSDSKILYDVYYLDYAEKDRVHVQAPVFSAKKTLSDTKSVEYRLVLDSMSGATPNGATPTNAEQTFTGVSGSAGYSTPAGMTPTREFSEKRLALSFIWDEQINSNKKHTFSTNLSTESDYHSLSFSNAYSLDVNNKLNTIGWGFGFALDFISPNGGKPEPLSEVNTNSNLITPQDDDEDDDDGDDNEFPELKGTADMLLGITQIVNRYIVTQLNYSHASSLGYLTDPYKVVSVIDQFGNPAIVPGTTDNSYRYEKRPKLRSINSIFWKTVFHLKRTVLRISYRHFWDDWGIKSDTVDVKFRIELGGGLTIQPHYREYKQTAADFYRHSIFETEALEHVSADYRLSEFQSKTVGIKIAKEFRTGGHIGLRFEKMIQTGNSYPDDAVGDQKNYNFFTRLEAVTALFSFSQRF